MKTMKSTKLMGFSAACITILCSTQVVPILAVAQPPKQQWVKQYEGEGACALAIDGSGKVYVTGCSWGGSSWLDYATVKYDVDGNEVWVARYDGPAVWSDIPYALAVDDSNNVYVTGDGGHDYATVKYDMDGNEVWVARYHYLDDDAARAIAVDELGSVYVTGISDGNVTQGDYATVKYDANGDEVWVARYNGPGSARDEATALAVDGLGNVYVTGEGWTGAAYEYITIKYTEHDFCLSDIVADFNHDCKVDLKDFAVFSSYWLECNFALEEDCW